MLEEICREKLLHLDGDFGQAVHMQRVFNMCADSKMFRTRGNRVKMGRWSSWLNSNRYWQGEKATVLMILTYMGMLYGWWKTTDDIPSVAASLRFLEVDLEDEAFEEVIAVDGEVPAVGVASASSGASAVAAHQPGDVASSSSSSSSALLAAPTHVSAKHGAEPSKAVSTLSKDGNVHQIRGVKESNQALNRMRGKCVNTLHFVASVLSNWYGGKVTEVIDAGVGTFADFFDLSKTVCKTVRGSLQFHKSYVNNGVEQLVVKAIAAIESSNVMERIGFTAPAISQYVPEGLKIEEACLATLLFDLILAESREFILSAMCFSHCYPFGFLALVEASDAEKVLSLSQLKKDWKLLCKLELVAIGDPWLQRSLSQLRWPSEQWAREIFIMLAEEKFTRVTPELQTQLDHFSRSWFGTKLNEDLFNRYRSREGDSSCGRFSRMSRWHVASTTKLMKEFDRREIQSTPAVEKTKPNDATTDLFQARASDFSSDKAWMDHLHEESVEWPHLTGQSMKLRGLIWSAFRRLDGDVAKLRVAWLSLLISPGHFVHYPGMTETERGECLTTLC